MGPTKITVHSPELEPNASGYYLIAALWRLLVRTTMIWAGFAILAPGLGVAWYAVLVALIMLNHLLMREGPRSIQAANKAALASELRRAEKITRTETEKDNESFLRRANS